MRVAGHKSMDRTRRGEPTLCVGASSGGHMTELVTLLEHRREWPVAPAVYVSTLDLADTYAGPGVRTYRVGECDRHRPLQALRSILRSVRIVHRERPSCVVTTGSLPLALFCLVAKLYGAKIIWIDSISQIDRVSVSGRLIKPFADLFFVQWPELAARYPGVRYAGELA